MNETGSPGGRGQNDGKIPQGVKETLDYLVLCPFYISKTDILRFLLRRGCYFLECSCSVNHDTETISLEMQLMFYVHELYQQ